MAVLRRCYTRLQHRQNVTVRNVTLFNRNSPEETGNIEVGGMGSHGVPPPLCAYKDGKFDPTNPCLAPGGNWQYELNLLRYGRNVAIAFGPFCPWIFSIHPPRAVFCGWLL